MLLERIVPRSAPKREQGERQAEVPDRQEPLPAA